MTRRSLAGAVVLPAAPLMLPEASHEQPPEIREDVRELRRSARAAVAALPSFDLAVMVASGTRGVYDQAVASLAPLGIQEPEIQLPVDTETLEHLSRLTQYPMFRGDPLGISHSVLALQLHASRRLMPVVPLNVPAGADFDVLVSVGASIAEAARDAERLTAVLCPGDLSAGLHEGSPAPSIASARDWDAAVVAAFEEGDLGALRELGPREAERVHSLGWAPLAVLHGVCASARLRPVLLGYRSPRGVGQVVAHCIPEDELATERYDLALPGHEHDGVVPRTGDPRG
ncbi:MAG: hypothetical protein M3O70_14615 [Actinomycetota bacterium]|nr:hypothetical protein [Actinomycetota bacterium]